MSPAPKRGEWGAGDMGAATAAVDIKFQRLNSQNRFEQRIIAATSFAVYKSLAKLSRRLPQNYRRPLVGLREFCGD
jgi:hypothetical protein